MSQIVHNTHEISKWNLLELKLGIMFLRSLYATGLPPSEALDELSRLQPKHADFWKAASRHTKTGKPLHTYLEGRWKEDIVAPIRIAETSGRMQEVFQGMEQTLEQQIESKKLLSKMYYPIGIGISAIFAGIFFITSVIPAMIGKTRFDNPPFIVTFSKWAQTALQDYGTLALIIITGLIAILFWLWNNDKHFKNAGLSIINSIPILGWSTRWIWFSIWANYVAIMIRADLSFTEIFRITKKTLPEHLQHAITLITTEIERGKSLSHAATPGKTTDDPRHQLPIHIINAFRMTDRTGNGAAQFTIASETLFEPGKIMLTNAIGTLNIIMMSVGASLIVVPVLMYVQAMVALSKMAM